MRTGCNPPSRAVEVIVAERINKMSDDLRERIGRVACENWTQREWEEAELTLAVSIDFTGWKHWDAHRMRCQIEYLWGTRVAAEVVRRLRQQATGRTFSD